MQETQEFDRLFQHLERYTNIQNILQKLSNDGHLNNLNSFIHKIFNSEILFTMKQLKSIKADSTGLDLHNQLFANLRIFKDNFQLILSNLINQIWSTNLKKENMDKSLTIIKMQMLH